MKYKFYLVNSDNLENAYITADDYTNLRLEMSTGDFGSHTAVGMNVLPEGEELLDLYRLDTSVIGHVLWFDKRDGYGVVQDTEGYEYYIDISVIPGRRVLQHGDIVRFNPVVVGKVACTGVVEFVSVAPLESKCV